jgi:hypothetical protein
LEENLIVSSGATLTIQSGATLTFKNNASLIVNGNLVVNGTTNNKVTFDFVNKNYTAQNGIKVYASGNATINNAKVKNAWYGIYAGAVNITVQNCEIQSCSRGIYQYSANGIPGK